MNIPQNSTQEAQQLGFPSTLFGFTPEQKAYWHEPGLPWLTQEIWDNPPLGHNGYRLIWHYGVLAGNHMAPRFPKGCMVNMAPVCDKKNLVVGKVYAYSWRDTTTGEWQYQIGRLEYIGGNYLEARADNQPEIGLIWQLREDEREAVWDVQEITHYASYPDLGL
jgi:hypothetical protein